ncbi:ABC transporter permease subunit [Desulfococcaceae bacterium HSG7]|nr:ABC transporter permease subunit [Desulfococcaceae bacterium HSG7]
MKYPVVYSIAAILLLLLMWETACRYFQVQDFILPVPSRIFTVAITRAALLAPHAGVTALEVLIGIVLALTAAVPLAIVMFAHSSVEKALAPFLIASQAVPVFAIAPLLVVWLGYGMASKVLMAAIIIFFPITVSLLQGFKSCDPEYRVLFQLMGANLC